MVINRVFDIDEVDELEGDGLLDDDVVGAEKCYCC